MKVVGITDEVSTCGACGRDDLKRTVVFQAEDGELRYLGTDCASRQLGRKASHIQKDAVAAQADTDRKAMLALNLQARASEILLVALETGSCIMEVTCSLGEMNALRMAFIHSGAKNFTEWLHQVAENGSI